MEDSWPGNHCLVLVLIFDYETIRGKRMASEPGIDKITRLSPTSIVHFNGKDLLK